MRREFDSERVGGKKGEKRGGGGVGGLLLAKVGLGLQIAGSDAHLLAANAEKGKRGRQAGKNSLF